MLKHAHEAMEKASAVASAVKSENWGEAERQLKDLTAILNSLTKGVGEKVRAELNAPESDPQDRG